MGREELVLGLKKQSKSADQNVTSIQNDYVRSIEQKEKQQHGHRVRLFRRLTAFGVVVAICLIWVVSTIYAQTQTIAEKEQLREEALASLEAAKQDQETLKEQILLLNDEEYLAKLARKEYFLSEEGEIIFSVPENEQKEAEKE